MNCYQDAGDMHWTNGPHTVATLEECATFCVGASGSESSFFGVVRG